MRKIKQLVCCGSVLLLLCFNALAIPQEQHDQLDQLLMQNPQQAVVTITALLESKITLSESERGQLHLKLSYAYYNQYLATEALAHAERSEKLLADTEETSAWQSAQLAMAEALDLSARAEEALPVAKSVLAWAEQHGDMELEIAALRSIGFSAMSLARHTQALQAMQRAYRLLQQHPDASSVHYKQFGAHLAQVHEYRHEPEASLPLYLEATEYTRENGLLLELSDALFGAGKAYAELGNTDAALTAFAQSLEQSLALNDEQGAAYTQSEIIKLKLKRAVSAENQSLPLLNDIKEVREVFKKGANRYQVTQSWAMEARIQLRANRLEEALEAANHAIADGDSQSLKQAKPDFLSLRAAIEYKLGNHEQAYTDMAEAFTLRNDVNRKTEKAAFQRLRAEFNLEQQETENKLLNEINSRQQTEIKLAAKQNTIIILVVFILLVAFVGVLAFYLHLRKQQRHLKQLASADPLTGMNNRRVILDQLNDVIKLAPEEAVVALLDIDNFKTINDTLGHHTGDEVLRASAQKAMAELPQGCAIGRIGGEEFLIIFYQRSWQQCQTWLQHYAEQVKNDDFLQRSLHGGSVTFSIGLTRCHPGDAPSDTLARADGLMYRAKTNGKNRVVCDEEVPSDQN